MTRPRTLLPPSWALPPERADAVMRAVSVAAVGLTIAAACCGWPS